MARQRMHAWTEPTPAPALEGVTEPRAVNARAPWVERELERFEGRRPADEERRAFYYSVGLRPT